MLVKKTSLVFLGALVGLGGCGDDTTGTGGAGGDGTTSSTTTSGSTTTSTSTGQGGGTAAASIEIDLQGLEPLGGGYEYEGWIMVDGAPKTTGRFQITAGTTVYSFELPAADVDAATAFILSVEPPNDADPAPSNVKVLGGDFAGSSATLSTAHPAALGVDLTLAAGGYILATPSTANIDADYGQGIWYLDPAAGPAASLSLPTLPSGFVYEGWVVGPNGPVSTGRFSSAAGPDSDAGGPDAGNDGTPPFPGQDFIDPATVLNGGNFMAVISVEPVPDDSPMPFAIKPLVDSIEDVAPPTTQVLSPNALPGGSASKK